MQKGKIYLGILIAFVIVIALAVGLNNWFTTGNAISSNTCTDSDLLKNYTLKGTATRGTKSYTDYCANDQVLYEAYCNFFKQPSLYAYGCPVKCRDGACVTCNKTQINYTNLEIIRNIENVIKNHQSLLFNLSKYNANYDFDNNSKVDATDQIIFRNEFIIFNSTINQTVLIDQDYDKLYWLIVDKITADINSSFGSPAAIDQYDVDNDCDIDASDLELIKKAMSYPNCRDYDYGKNYSIKSNATDSNKTYVDYCGNANVVYESYCNFLGASLYANTCQYGCLDGACNPAPEVINCSNLTFYSPYETYPGYYKNYNNYSVSRGICLQATTPNGGETIKIGTNYTIKWKQQNITSVTINVKSCSNCAENVASINPIGNSSSQSYVWYVGSNYQYLANRNLTIEIFGTNGLAGTSVIEGSDGFFSIIP